MGLLPGFDGPLYAVVGLAIAFALQLLEQALSGAPLPFWTLGVLLQPDNQQRLIITQLRLGLYAALVGRWLALIEVLLDGIAREPQFARNPADRLAVDQVTTADLGNGFHAEHPRFLRQKHRRVTDSRGWSILDAVSPLNLVSFAR